MRKKRRAILLILLSSLVVLAVLFDVLFIRWRPISYKAWHYQCGICGTSLTKGEKSFLGRQYKSFEYFPSQEKMKPYDDLVGVPHEHEWVYSARTVSQDAILGGGWTRHHDAFPLRPMLARRSLLTIKEEFAEEPREFRQKLHFRLINCKSWDEFLEVLEEEKGRLSGAGKN